MYLCLIASPTCTKQSKKEGKRKENTKRANRPGRRSVCLNGSFHSFRRIKLPWLIPFYTRRISLFSRNHHHHHHKHRPPPQYWRRKKPHHYTNTCLNRFFQYVDFFSTEHFLLTVEERNPSVPLFLYSFSFTQNKERIKPKMLWITKLSGLVSAALVLVILSPSFQTFPPAEAIKSSPSDPFSFRRAPNFRNAADCAANSLSPLGKTGVCDPSLVHVAITLDIEYLRGSIAAVHSILQHSLCPENVFFHFLVSQTSLETVVRSTFPQLKFKVYYFDPERVRSLISTSVRQALEQPLNYARNYLADLLEPCVRRVIYLDSDLVVVDDISKLWHTSLGTKTIGAPEYCHANFTKYFTSAFWKDNRLSSTFSRRNPCYFNTGVMVIDLVRWTRLGYTKQIEKWMEIQKMNRIYELGSLPPFLLVFAGNVSPIEHRWNQHGLGGDNVKASCRDLHQGPVSLLHWSGSGKPWIRLDSRNPCPLDSHWAPYDLYQRWSA